MVKMMKTKTSRMIKGRYSAVAQEEKNLTLQNL